MDKYISFKIVEAEPMYRLEAFKKGYHRIAEGDDIKNQPNDYGYHILYENGYNSWCPAKEFEERNKPLNPLRETGVLMNSNDYKERFVAEYRQLQFRYNKLSKHLDNITNCIEEKEFSITATIEIYYDQLSYMLGYIKTLEKRAKFENINLD